MIRNLLLILGIGFTSLATAQTATMQTTTPATSTTTTTTTTTQPAMPLQQPGAPTMNIADQNAKVGAAFLASNKTQQGVVTLADGLQYKIIDPGNGPRPGKNDIVTVDYEGKHLNGQVFDSSYQRGQPATFPVSAVIPGWQEALQLMSQGATWELYIPANLAYGERGAPGAIGPNETLIFRVKLISVQPGRP